MGYTIYRDELIRDLEFAQEKLKEGDLATTDRILNDLSAQFASLPNGEVYPVLEAKKKFVFDVPKRVMDFKDVLNNAEHLFSMHPAPWRIESDSLDGYVVDANSKKIFGGEQCEGYVSENDMEIVALVDVINSLWVYMKGEK